MPSTLVVGDILYNHDRSLFVTRRQGPFKRQWCGGRAVFTCGGDAPVRDHMQYVNIGTTGNASDFAEMHTGYNVAGSISNGSRAIHAGGQSPTGDENTDQIQYFTIGTFADSVDFSGETVATRAYLVGGASNGSRGVIAGGSSPGTPYTDAMDYLGYIPGQDAIDFGNLDEARLGPCGTQDGVRGVWSGGWDPGASDVIDYITIGTPGNATDFGNLTEARHVGAAASNGIRAVMIQGWDKDTIDYWTIGITPSNATDFGEATETKNYLSATSDGERAIRGGGSPVTDTMDYFSIGITSDAIDFGNLNAARASLQAFSGD